MTVSSTSSAPLPSPLATRPASSAIEATPSAEQSGDSAQLRKVAQQFEAIFLRQMLASARNSSLAENDLFSSQGEETFAEMRDAHFADLAAGSGMLGFGASIEKQLSAHAGIQPLATPSVSRSASRTAPPNTASERLR